MCTEGTQDQVKDFVGWDLFFKFIKQHKLTVAITEFGGHPSQRCAKWIDSFLTILEDNRVTAADDGGVLMWTLWRTCPHASWYPETLGGGAMDCVQFAPPTPNDPVQYVLASLCSLCLPSN